MRQQAVIGVLAVALLGALAYISFLFVSPSSPLRSEASSTGSQEIEPAVARAGTVVKRDGLSLTLDETGVGTSTIELADSTLIRSADSEGKYQAVGIDTLGAGDIVTVNLTDGQSVIQSVDIVIDK